MEKILKFGADWCTQCVTAERYLSKTASKRDYEVVSIDVEKDEGMTVKYGVRNIPVFIAVDAAGRELDRMVGFNPALFEKFVQSQRG